MASNYKSQLEGQLTSAQTQANTLSNRLAEMDKYRSQVLPKVRGQMTDLENVPAGYDRIGNYKALLNFIGQQNQTRGELQQQFTSQQNVATNILGQLEQLENEAGVNTYDMLKEYQLAKELGLDTTPYETMFGKQKGDPEELETYNLIQDIKNADLGPLTGTLRVRGGQLAENLGVVNEYTDTRKRVQQLVDRLALKSREAIKGTGTISDAEQEMLKNAQTFLKGNLSEKAFRGELDRLEKEAVANLGYIPDPVAGASTMTKEQEEVNFIEEAFKSY